MRKPNYSMERKDRERAKQAKAAAKAEKRAAMGAESRQSDASGSQEQIEPRGPERAKSED